MGVARAHLSRPDRTPFPEISGRATRPIPRLSVAGARVPIATFLIVSDPDSRRREDFLARASETLAPVSGLSTQRVDAGSASILWSAAARAPVSTDVAPTYTAIVLGDALLAGDGGRADARAIAADWTRGDDSVRCAYDGFYAAAVAESDGRVIIGADVLGFFPVYYAAIGDVLLAGASPEPFRHHPAFRSAVSLEGLLTVLMFGGPFYGPCLLENVRRLSIGRLLMWRPGGPAHEAAHYDLPTSNRYAPLSFDDQVDLMHHAYQRVVRRHHPSGDRQGLLLSGGRDSRLVAGYLHAQGSRVDALTLGLEADHEVTCAKGVARALGFPHHVADVPFEQYVDYATRCARWEHLGAGMGTLHTWGAIEPSRALPARSSNGYGRSRDLPPLPTEFGALSQRLTRRALRPDSLRALVRGAEARDVVDGLVARFEASYQQPNDAPPDRAWLLFMRSYTRFYVGGVPWRLSFGSWPVMAELDREFLDTWVGIPLTVLADRRIVETILTRKFPRLARLPLDRNAHNTHPIAPSLAYRARQWLSYRVPPPRGARGRTDSPGPERRQYYRQYDLDNPGWRAVRAAAEPHRALLADWLEMPAVNRIVPPPGEPAKVADPMTEGFETKSLLGLMLWMGEHAAGGGS